MGIQINIGDHTSSFDGLIAFPPLYRSDMNWARARARRIAAEMPSANVYFRALPGGRSLTQLLADGSIWVNYHPTGHIDGLPDFFGVTDQVGGKEIGISVRRCRTGRWGMLGTLIHELAHSNGAAGGQDHSAEGAKLACGLGRSSEQASGIDDPSTPYNPNTHG